MVKCVLIGSLAVLLIAYWMNTDCFVDYWLPALPEIDSNKTWSDRNIENDEVRQISIKVPEPILNSLRERLRNRSVPRSMPDSNFKYGFNSDYLNKLIEHWLTKYDWPAWEAIINKFPHFFTDIDGLQVHFIHARPILKPGQRSVPILLLHGWPGSFFEFYKVIPMLIETTESEEVAYEVICPSLPGFGWSEAAQKPGLGIPAIASIMFKLMDRVNVTDKFYVQGGDFGSLIASTMSKINSRRISGIHVNMAQSQHHSLRYWFKIFIGSILPRKFHFMSEQDQDYVYPVGQKFKSLMSQMGYFWLQATRPATIGVALTDSPTGLAAYIIEKFGAWSNDVEDHLNSVHGGIEDSGISVDEMLTNVMIYYITNTISTSVRLYKESINEADVVWMMYPVTVPTGIALFPKEIVKLPRSLASLTYRDIRQFTHMSRGGHFAALEEPELLVNDVKAFVATIEGGVKEK